MADQTRFEEIHAAADSLKQELKRWEKAFAFAHGGQKPRRDDIRNDARMASKYREYERLRGRKHEASTEAPPSPSRKNQRKHTRKNSPLKERSHNAVSATPKRETKMLTELLPLDLDTILEEEPTPACIRYALGPTPQKDGRVLGIFDMLPSASPSKVTPSKTRDISAVVSATPSKRTTAPSSSAPALSRTPPSSSKRFYLEGFVGTPVKRKHEDDNGTPCTAKRQFATPSFLKRGFPLTRVDEEPGTTAPPFKKPRLMRSLSSVIQGMRKQEEKRMDDELDVLNEIEAEEAHAEAGSMPKAPPSEEYDRDQDAIEMPLGPDQGAESSDEADDANLGALDANGQPRKVWKKKGLKRQTKRVIMRPVLHRPQKADNGSSHHSDADATEKRPLPSEKHNSTSTQQGKARRQRRRKDEGKADDVQTGSEMNAEGNSKDDAGANTKRKKKGILPTALAHTNFRKLKIKNKNSKANGKGRFGRR